MTFIYTVLLPKITGQAMIGLGEITYGYVFHYVWFNMSYLLSSLRIYILLQGEGVLEVQQPAAESGARLP